MKTQPYIGGSFAKDDSQNYRLDVAKQPFFLNQNNRKHLSGYETGADALAVVCKFILTKTECTSIYFPLHYCQDTILRLQQKVQTIQIRYYSHVNDLESIAPAALVWNHFNGYLEVPHSLSEKGWLVIEDAVQSLNAVLQFSGFVLITSFRKWLELDLALVLGDIDIDEAWLCSGPSDYLIQKKEAEETKALWKKEQLQELEATYLKQFAKAELLLDNPNVYCASMEEMEHIDWEKLQKQRQENAKVLISQLQMLQLEVISQSELFVMVKMSFEQRDELRKILAKNGIFAPVHWLDSLDDELANTLLSLPIDQRYQAADMERVIQIIKEYIEH